ncbi:hypothetical protein NMY22_g9897 [Coprinellus aureogranulatus]|nr:hypothetical protein NMY22_g9897 [Coprinellus aureogranulatus]
MRRAASRRLQPRESLLPPINPGFFGRQAQLRIPLALCFSATTMESVVSLLPALDRLGIAESKRQQRESIWPSTEVDTREILRQLGLSNPWPEISQLRLAQRAIAALWTTPSRGRRAPSSPCTVPAPSWTSRSRSERANIEATGGQRKTKQRIVSIGKHLRGAAKMGPSELLDVPLFEQVFTPSNRIKDLTSYANVLSMLDQLCNDASRRIAATVITQASQSAVCVKMALLEDDLYIVFDPHPRMDHPNGPGFMLSTSKSTTASFLHCLLGSSSTAFDVSGTDLFQPLQYHYFTAHLLDAKESYYRIMAYQNEQTLRDSFLCTHEESLSASVDYLWNQLLSPADSLNASAGPSSPSRLRAASSSSAESSTSSRSSFGIPGSSPPSLPSLLTSYEGRRLTSVSESWRPETPFKHYHLEHLKLISHKPTTPDLPPPIKVSVDCVVCFDTYPLSMSVKLSGCEHRFCKECMRGHVSSFLENGRFPIQCPVCLLDRGIPDPGDVTESILYQLHMPAESIQKFGELKKLQHSVRLECPSCNYSDYLPRKDYLRSTILTCLSPACCYKWCKACSKPISSTPSSPSSPQSRFSIVIGSTKSKGNSSLSIKAASGSNTSDGAFKHACKGDGFEKLMKKKGWRHCPGCTMPVIKDSGCNHMSCVAPGCHTYAVFVSSACF